MITVPEPKTKPRLDAWSRPFWDACRRHRLVAQRARRSGLVWFPPGPVCPDDRSSEWDWVELSGKGVVESWVVFHERYFEGFSGDDPYNVALVKLVEGPSLITNLVGMDETAVVIGLPVEVTFEDVGSEFSLPKFRPAGSFMGEGERR